MELTFTLTERPEPRRARRKVAKRRRPARRYVCVNCAASFDATWASAYCGPRCRMQAKAVRYARGKNCEYGDAMPDDIALAIRIKIAHALTDGYDERARRLTAEQRKEIIERDRGQCVLCGASGTEIDHIDGASNTPSNLRLLCDPCHNKITVQHLQPVSYSRGACGSGVVARPHHLARPARALR